VRQCWNPQASSGSGESGVTSRHESKRCPRRWQTRGRPGLSLCRPPQTPPDRATAGRGRPRGPSAEGRVSTEPTEGPRNAPPPVFELGCANSSILFSTRLASRFRGRSVVDARMASASRVAPISSIFNARACRCPCQHDRLVQRRCVFPIDHLSSVPRHCHLLYACALFLTSLLAGWRACSANRRT